MNVDANDLRSFGEWIAPVLVGIAAWWKSHRAAKYAKPTGNGFAKKVTDALGQIQETQTEHGEVLRQHSKKLKKSDKRLRAVENREPASDQNPS